MFVICMTSVVFVFLRKVERPQVGAYSDGAGSMNVIAGAPVTAAPSDHEEAAVGEVRLPFVQFSVSEISDLRRSGNGCFVDFDEVM